MTIAIVDYGMGNVGSIRNMLRHVGAEAEICTTADEVAAADKLILAGVGAFDRAMQRLDERQLMPILNRRVLEERTPVLGICLGMQLFSDSSEEGELPGLGWIPGRTVRIDPGPEHSHLKVPHMGWNTICEERAGPLLAHLPEEPRFYFVHSFHVVCDDQTHVLATTEHGRRMTAAVQHGWIFGTQFHPEKSHRFGMRVMENFARRC